jgi:hypothetical protein
MDNDHNFKVKNPRDTGDWVEMAHAVQVSEDVLPVVGDSTWGDHWVFEQFETDFATKEVGHFALLPAIVNL